MKGKICSLSAALFLLLAAAGSVHAQSTTEECQPLKLNRRGVPTTPFRYTVNYAVSNPDPSGSVGIPGAETAVHIINRHPASHHKAGCVYVLFKDKDGVTQGIAQGTIPPNGSRVFATSENVSNAGTPPPFIVDYPAAAADTSSAAQVIPSIDPINVPFEGRAEIYSYNPLLQVAPFVVDHGAMSAVPVQRAGVPTRNN